jgi:hypothetical protein
MCQPNETAICCRAGSKPGGPSPDASLTTISLSHIAAAVPAAAVLKRELVVDRHQFSVAPAIKPFDEETMLREVDTDRPAVTLENHTGVAACSRRWRLRRAAAGWAEIVDAIESGDGVKAAEVVRAAASVLVDGAA